MSITGGIDVDGFARGDLAIGAPGKDLASGNVVLLRTLEVAHLKPETEMESDPSGAVRLQDTG